MSQAVAMNAASSGTAPPSTSSVLSESGPNHGIKVNITDGGRECVVFAKTGPNYGITLSIAQSSKGVHKAKGPPFVCGSDAGKQADTAAADKQGDSVALKQADTAAAATKQAGTAAAATKQADAAAAATKQAAVEQTSTAYVITAQLWADTIAKDVLKLDDAYWQGWKKSVEKNGGSVKLRADDFAVPSNISLDLLDWRPTYGIERGIGELWEWCPTKKGEYGGTCWETPVVNVVKRSPNLGKRGVFCSSQGDDCYAEIRLETAAAADK